MIRWGKLWRIGSAPPPDPSPWPRTPRWVWMVTIRREALGWKPPIGEFAIQKRSLSGFSRCSASTRVILSGLAGPRGPSPGGVAARSAAGATKAGLIAFRRVLGGLRRQFTILSRAA